MIVLQSSVGAGQFRIRWSSFELAWDIDIPEFREKTASFYKKMLRMKGALRYQFEGRWSRQASFSN